MPLTPAPALRWATGADWPAIASLLRAHRLPLDGAQVHLPDFVVAVSNGEVVACAGAEVHGDVALLRSVAVAPGLQGRGVGRLMVAHLIEEARRRRLSALYLLTLAAPEYFARHGFKRLSAGQAPAALRASAEFQGACPESAVLMTLPLVAPTGAATEARASSCG